MHYTQQLYFHSKQGVWGEQNNSRCSGKKKLPKKLVDPVGNYLMEARLIYCFLVWQECEFAFIVLLPM